MLIKNIISIFMVLQLIILSVGCSIKPDTEQNKNNEIFSVDDALISKSKEIVLNIAENANNENINKILGNNEEQILLSKLFYNEVFNNRPEYSCIISFSTDELSGFSLPYYITNEFISKKLISYIYSYANEKYGINASIVANILSVDDIQPLIKGLTDTKTVVLTYDNNISVIVSFIVTSNGTIEINGCPVFLSDSLNFDSQYGVDLFLNSFLSEYDISIPYTVTSEKNDVNITFNRFSKENGKYLPASQDDIIKLAKKLSFDMGNKSLSEKYAQLIGLKNRGDVIEKIYKEEIALTSEPIGAICWDLTDNQLMHNLVISAEIEYPSIVLYSKDNLKLVNFLSNIPYSESSCLGIVSGLSREITSYRSEVNTLNKLIWLIYNYENNYVICSVSFMSNEYGCSKVTVEYYGSGSNLDLLYFLYNTNELSDSEKKEYKNDYNLIFNATDEFSMWIKSGKYISLK